MKKQLLISATILACVPVVSAEKKVLDHTSFDNWKGVINHSFSRNGEWGAFSVNPQEGDGVLTFYSVKGDTRIDLPRGYNPSFSADGKWGVALIKPLFSQTRDAKIKGKKDFDLPQDTLAIINLSDRSVRKIANVTAYKIGEEGGEFRILTRQFL